MKTLLKRASGYGTTPNEADNEIEETSFVKNLHDDAINETPLLSKPRTYHRRWIILLVFMLLSTINNFTQYSFAPISTITLEHYHITTFYLNLLAIIFMVNGFTTRFVGMYVLDAKGLGLGVFIATVLNLIGCWLRWWPGAHSYAWLVIGQSFCAAAMSFIDIAGPKLAANWFPPQERTTATAFASGPIFLAMLISYSVVPQLVKSGNDISNYLLVQAIVTSVSSILIFLIFRGQPPTPPSYSASVKKHSFIETFKLLIKNWNFLFLFLAFSLDLGFAVAFSVLMDQIVKPAGYTNVEAGLLGSIWISFAIIGGLVAGPIIDRTRAYKFIMVLGMCVVIVALIIFTLMIQFAHKNLVVLSFVVGFLGLGGACLPALLESTIEVVFPIPEASAMGVLFLGLNVTAIIFTIGMDGLKNPVTQSYVLPMWIAVGFAVLSAIFMSLFRGDYKRLQYEDQVKEQQYHPEKWVDMEPTNERSNDSVRCY